MKAREFGSGQGFRLAARTNPSAVERLVGVNVADTAEELLIQQGALDGSIASTEEALEVVEGNLERLETGSGKEFAGGSDGQFAEHAGIDEADFFPGRELRNQMRVLGKIGGGIDNQGAAGHAEVDDPLSARIAGFLFEICDDVFADAAHNFDASTFEHFGDGAGSGLERLA